MVSTSHVTSANNSDDQAIGNEKKITFFLMRHAHDGERFHDELDYIAPQIMNKYDVNHLHVVTSGSQRASSTAENLIERFRAAGKAVNALTNANIDERLGTGECRIIPALIEIAATNHSKVLFVSHEDPIRLASRELGFSDKDPKTAETRVYEVSFTTDPDNPKIVWLNRDATKLLDIFKPQL